MSRKEELLNAVDNNEILMPVITEIVYLEEQLDYLRSLPKIRVSKKDLSKQQTTPAAKLYKEMLQQYTNLIKVLLKATGADEAEEDSPLRRWMNERMDTR